MHYEPAPADSRARRIEGLLLSAHRAGSTPNTFATLGEMVVDDLGLILRGLPAQRRRRAADVVPDPKVAGLNEPHRKMTKEVFRYSQRLWAA